MLPYDCYDKINLFPLIIACLDYSVLPGFPAFILQDLLHNVQAQGKMKFQGPLFKKHYEFQDDDSRVLKQEWGPF